MSYVLSYLKLLAEEAVDNVVFILIMVPTNGLFLNVTEVELCFEIYVGWSHEGSLFCEVQSKWGVVGQFM